MTEGEEKKYKCFILVEKKCDKKNQSKIAAIIISKQMIISVIMIIMMIRIIVRTIIMMITIIIIITVISVITITIIKKK